MAADYNLWWGYLLTNGDIKVRRLWDNQAIRDAKESPFYAVVVEPFKADIIEEAFEIVKGIVHANCS